MAKKIIFHDPTKHYVYKGDPKKKQLIPNHKSLFYAAGRGLPIGNLTSQFFANVYLNEFDQFVKKNLKAAYYLRYVDDFVLVDPDKHALLSHIQHIRKFLREHLSLELHPGKIRLQNISKGVDFLGYFIKPTHTLVRQSVVRRFKNRLYRGRNPEDGFFPVDYIPVFQSYLGHFGHADTYNLKKKLEN